ncbi:MAG: histidine kinase [Flavobacteriaceae bacterium]|nr:MAG: histidine kinase [Flavobacteriaceae bacterium]
MNKWFKNILFCFLIGIVIQVLGVLMFGDFDLRVEYLVKTFFIYQMYSFVIGFSNMGLFAYLNRKRGEEELTKKRLLLNFVYSIVLTLICLLLLNFVTSVLIFENSLDTFVKRQRPEYYVFGMIISVIIILAFHLLYFYKELNERKVKEHQIVAKTETAKYESLKSQIDPHFLFNSLNVLTALIGENPAQAEKFTTKLSKVYRYVLEQKNKDLISLEEELSFARVYMDLLKMRFEDAVVFSIPDKVSDPALKIMPLSLQLLLENAVKHNSASEQTPLNVTIEEKEGYLIVSNNYNPKSSIEKGTKVGLKNIIDRYNLITQKQVKVLKSNAQFIVELPLLTKKSKKMKIVETNNQKYIKAVERVKEIKKFYSGLLSYVVVIPCLVFIYYRYTPHTIQWFWFAAFGWGIGLVFQWFKAFSYHPLLGGDWEAKKIREFMNKEEPHMWE